MHSGNDKKIDLFPYVFSSTPHPIPLLLVRVLLYAIARHFYFSLYTIRSLFFLL